MKTMKSFWAIVRSRSLVIVAAFVIAALYLYRLAGIPNGQLASVEQATQQASRTLHDIIASPLFLPLNALRWMTTKILPSHEITALRLPTVLLALMTTGALVYVIRRWYGQRTMIFGVALVVTSAWFLHIGRLGTNDIAYLAAVPLLIASGLILRDYPDKFVSLVLLTGIICNLMYVPGLVWLIIATLVWLRSDLRESWSSSALWQRFSISLLATLLVAPFVYGLIQNLHPDFGLTWLGLPTNLPTWQEPLKNFAATILFVFVRTPLDPARWLGTLPLLDAFLAISFIAGIVFYFSHLRAERTRLLIMYTSIGLVLCTVGGAVTRSILVPLIYLVAIGGIAYLLHQWLKVFPRNPLARRLGIGLVCVAVALSCVYGARQYFIAWPHNPDTVQTFSVAP